MVTKFENLKIYINLCQIFLEIKMDFKFNLYLSFTF